MSFASANILTAILESLVAVASAGFQHSFIVFMAHGPFFEYKQLGQMILSLRCAMCAYLYGILGVHFVYRYLAVCRPMLIAHFFDPFPIFITSSSVLFYGSSWLLIIYIFLWPDQQFEDLVDEEFKTNHNISSHQVPFIMGYYEWPITDFWRNGIIGIIFATLISVFAMTLYVVMAYKIHISLQFSMLSMIVRRMHRNLLLALGLQTLVPLIATCAPCLIVWYYPVFAIHWSKPINSFVVPFLSAYPAVDPLVIMFVLADYRNAILTFFKMRKKPEFSQRSTKLNTKEALKRQLQIEREISRHDAASPRMHWKDSKLFLLCVVNVTLGIGNIVNFPRRSYKFEGGTFLMVYLIVMIIFAAPVVYMEMIMGQYHRGTTLLVVQRCAPILQGVGWLAALSSVFSVVPYQFEVAKIFKYLLTIIVLNDNNGYLKSCNNSWNTGACYEFFSDDCVQIKETSHGKYKGHCNVFNEDLLSLESAEIQFLNMVHSKSQSFAEIGDFDRSTFLTLAVLWLVTALLYNRGIQKIGQSSYIPVILIFLVVPALLLSSLKMEGALRGIQELLVINWQAVMGTQIWIEALQQAAFSLAIGYGSLMTISSYAPPEAHTFKILVADLILDTSLSVMCTATVFATLGYMSDKLDGMSIYKIVPSEDAEVVSHIIFPVLMRGVSDQSSLWLITYYIVMTMLGFGTSIQLTLTISSTIAEHFNISTKTYAFDKISVVTCLVLLGFGSLLCFESGDHWAGLLGNVGSIVQFSVIFIEIIVMCEFYGVDHIYEDIQVMMGKPVLRFWGHIGYISPLWKFCWSFSPALSAVLILFTTFQDFPYMQNSRYAPYLYEFTECVMLFLIFLIIPCFMMISSLVMKQHVEEIEGKEFDIRIMWMKQKQLRSWDRIASHMLRIDVGPDDPQYATHVEAVETMKDMFYMLPDNPPNDVEGMWRLVHRPFFKIKGTLVKPRQEQAKDLKKVKKVVIQKTLQTMFTGTEKPELVPKAAKPRQKASNKPKNEKTTITDDVVLTETVELESLSSVPMKKQEEPTAASVENTKTVEGMTKTGEKKVKLNKKVEKLKPRDKTLDTAESPKNRSEKRNKSADFEKKNLNDTKNSRMNQTGPLVENTTEQSDQLISGVVGLAGTQESSTLDLEEPISKNKKSGLN